MTGIESFGQINSDLAKEADKDCSKYKSFKYEPEDCNYRDLHTWTTIDWHFEQNCFKKESCKLNIAELLRGGKRKD